MILLIFFIINSYTGITLMYVLLDVHPIIRCSPGSSVIFKILEFISFISTHNIESERLKAAGLYPVAIDSAVRSFISSLIRNAGKNAPVLCNKDPLSFIHLEYLAEIFPEAKFVHMVRDGRAVINSLVKLEPSTSQVVHPIHLASLTSWASNGSVLPESFISSIRRESDVLKTLGYADLGVPPDYGTPENQVVNMTSHLINDPQSRRIF
ncbi:putative protein-tyrosine sulfotransferase [Schistosoma mansoni]|uniref:putative protein-tyrosine sulfotransferase n=1 Tax=Schistosoma mansoni TaxID=6183 RepID=UPI0001A62EE6|nr:putative protein-tyrosine sulfotransferase [Schistosoma mansoni]|eukprot:XP_018650967.1 putative protein-tyrosine sulfotransferase [Schistosoma mansoni]